MNDVTRPEGDELRVGQLQNTIAEYFFLNIPLIRDRLFSRRRCWLRVPLTESDWQNPLLPIAAIFIDCGRKSEVVFLAFFSVGHACFSTVSDVIGPTESESVEIRHFLRWRSQTGSSFSSAFFA